MGETIRLRNGFTTGTCAAAAAACAARLFFELESDIAQVHLVTPDGTPADLEIVDTVRWPLCAPEFSGGGAGSRFDAVSCAVRKDGGDDPDVTHGALVWAKVRRRTSQTDGDRIGSLRRCYCDGRYPGICITGGRGIGIVTRPGLPDPVGYPAINPVPREMIFREVSRAAGMQCARCPIEVEISIPDGVELAERTFNPHLGIVGGISVLGTSGVVHPMSEAALTATIAMDIRVKAAAGRRILAVAPGNYGQRYLHEETGLDMDSFVKCSNYIGDTWTMLEEAGIRRALLAGHPGKLVKVAGGMLNTHSRYGDCRMEIMASCARQAQGPQSLCADILQMNTTDEAAARLAQEGILSKVMRICASRVKAVLEAHARVETEVMLFSGAYGCMAGSPGAGKMVEALKEESLRAENGVRKRKT